jgi:hypothetical protein
MSMSVLKPEDAHEALLGGRAVLEQEYVGDPSTHD